MSRYKELKKDLMPYMLDIVNMAKMAYVNATVSPVTRYQEIYRRSPESYTVLWDSYEKKIVAYIIAIPVNHDLYDLSITSAYNESQLTPDTIRDFTYGSNYICFFSIVANPRNPNKVEILRILSNLYVEKLKRMATQGIFVTKASAITWSSVGQRLCEGMRMINSGYNETGKIYHNDKFHRLFVDIQTKKSIIKFFIDKKEGSNEQ